jgi:nitrogen PTS system EIIA component
MEIGVKQAAELLNVSDKTIYRWVSAAQIPFYRVGAQYRFSRNELLAWVAADQPTLTTEPVSEQEQTTPLSLERSLREGGIFYRVGGSEVREVLEQMLSLMKLPARIDSARILERLYARERITTTGIGDGIAIPHCRELAIPGLVDPVISLGFLEHPVDFSAIDRKPVEIVFILLSPSASSSIRIMSRLAHAIRRPTVAKLLKNIGVRDQIFEAVAEVDQELDG